MLAKAMTVIAALALSAGALVPATESRPRDVSHTVGPVAPVGYGQPADDRTVRHPDRGVRAPGAAHVACTDGQQGPMRCVLTGTHAPTDTGLVPFSGISM